MPTCKLCGRSFDTMTELYMHLHSECSKIPRSRRCPVCGSKYRSIRFMRHHLINEALIESKHMNYLISI
ncbi:hypothetical protein [Vulcanisaeta distributa]|uniref:hypothetical protein n=1 Tax=Vulcanisaeta distributa TaxID=164451 RepID=UPI0006D21FCD|nr:hypothetical protein [Vulcanisaeta distributa]